MGFVSNTLTRIKQLSIVEVVKNTLNSSLNQVVAVVALAAILLGIILMTKCFCSLRDRNIEPSESPRDDQGHHNNSGSSDLDSPILSHDESGNQLSSQSSFDRGPAPIPPPKPLSFRSRGFVDSVPEPTTPLSTSGPNLRNVREAIASQSCTIGGSPLTEAQRQLQAGLLGEVGNRMMGSGSQLPLPAEQAFSIESL